MPNGPSPNESMIAVLVAASLPSAVRSISGVVSPGMIERTVVPS